MRNLLFIHHPAAAEDALSRPRTAALAALLGKTFRIALAARPFRLTGTEPVEWVPPELPIVKKEARRFDAVLVACSSLPALPFVLELRSPLVLDVDDPLLVRASLQGVGKKERTALLLRMVRRADLFLCESESRENLAIGLLLGSGRLNPDTYATGADLDEMLIRVPAGEAREARHTRLPETGAGLPLPVGRSLPSGEEVRARLAHAFERLFEGGKDGRAKPRAVVRFEGRRAIGRQAGKSRVSKGPLRVLVVTCDRVGEKMAGTGTRFIELATVVASRHEVFFAAPSPRLSSGHPFTVVDYEHGGFTEIPRPMDVVLTDPETLMHVPELRKLGRRLFLDLSCPNILENLDRESSMEPELKRLVFASNLRTLFQALEQGDWFYCGGEPQRELWTAFLGLMGRLEARGEKVEEEISGAIGLVPLGIPRQPPAPDKDGIRAALPAIGPQDHILWYGAVWPWFDVETVLKAMQIVSASRGDVKLVFVVGFRPAGPQEADEASRRLEARCREMGLFNRSVFFLDWVPYGERHRYLQDAELIVLTHKDGLETRFSYRTRFIDSLWCTVPLLITEGGIVSRWVQDHGLGATVPPANPGALAARIKEIVDNPALADAFRQNLRRVAPHFHWENTTAAVLHALESECDLPAAVVQARFPRDRMRRACYYFRREGPVALAGRIRTYLQRNHRRGT
jgi:glycosyltransferase involved in cell wall biosynthesis